MAGKIQHEIPQLYQRGFLIPDNDGAEQVFVFRRGMEPFPSNIDRAGAETFFYSRLAHDGQKTLDDKITEYEARLGTLVRTLRSLPAGTLADPEIAAEVVAHLTTRNAHLRSAFTHGVERFAAGALEAFDNEDNVRHLVGVDGPIVSAVFHKHLAEALNKPRAATLGISPEVLEQLAFSALRERFSSLFEQVRPIIQSKLGELGNEAQQLAGEGHQKALSESIAPELRIRKLRTLNWRIIGAEHDLILPDCVALAAEGEQELHPLVMVDLDRIEFALLPLTSRTLVMGTLDKRSFDLTDFNRAAAVCSHVYFLSSSNTPALCSLIEHIGTRSFMAVDFAVDESLRGISPPERR